MMAAVSIRSIKHACLFPMCSRSHSGAAHRLSTLPMGAVAHTYLRPNFEYVREWLS